MQNDRNDLISRQDAIDALAEEVRYVDGYYVEYDAVISETDAMDAIKALPSAQPEEVIPHRNYKCFSDYWCECGWHLGKNGDVKYCSNCGRKVNWE